jgi:hypothetical protein
MSTTIATSQRVGSDDHGWSDWRKFPNPRQRGILIAPFGHGCYELRRSDTGQLVLFGKGRNVASRMTSLLPRPLGCGTRNNAAKRNYILLYIERIEYRTICCTNEQEAGKRERDLKSNKSAYVFPT